MSEREVMSSSKRVFHVLEALNQYPNASLEQLHRHTKLPKSTLVRIMNTLIDSGYCERLGGAAGYALTERVMLLSSGLLQSSRLLRVARPLLLSFTETHKWTVILASLHKKSMILHFSSHFQSPFADHNRDYTNAKLPILNSAVGRAYLAFCEEKERDIALSLLRSSSSPVNVTAKDTKFVGDLLANIREQGYTTMATGPDDAIGIALPIFENKRACAAISMRYLRVSMSEEEALKRYLPPLKRLVKDIESGLRRFSQSNMEAISPLLLLLSFGYC